MCSLPLQRVANYLCCEQKHTYDFAKEGYCNLLLVQQKASSDPGDNKEMVAARKRFLDAGFYSPIAEKLAEIVGKTTSSQSRTVDAGCGEGYYLDFLAKHGIYNLSGFDISKWAVQAAAKRNPKIAWAVASNRKLPYAPHSTDLLLSMFGFPIWENFLAAQSETGKIILVDPGPGHLLELRRIIYPKVNATELTSVAGAEAVGYRLEQEEALHFPIELSSPEQIQDLLSMTPHAFRINEEGRGALARLQHLSVTVEVVFRLLSL
jgi:23S rRNA (guanine745-N1)-methyltransferase